MKEDELIHDTIVKKIVQLGKDLFADPDKQTSFIITTLKTYLEVATNCKKESTK